MMIRSMYVQLPRPVMIAFVATAMWCTTGGAAQSWSVPLAGNAFRSAPEPGGRSIGRDGNLSLRDESETFSVFFHVDQAATIKLAVQGRAVGETGTINLRLDQATHTVELSAADRESGQTPSIEVKAGYVQVDLSLGSGSNGVKVEHLLVNSADQEVQLDYVKTNDGNMFYWGRRGPSVHLAYRIPREVDLTYAYSEITVPSGQDTIGTYFMANGFGEGYFGMQVNSETERRVLFSIWSPFRTDNPNEIPEEDRVLTLAKGKNVVAKDFGNEGSGGQSFFRYPWKAGRTYRFLTEVKPNGKGQTQYTSWFGDKEKGEWLLVASFQRPKTDKHLTGFHSFLENFSPATGHLQRSAHYANQWVCDVTSQWHEIRQAKFTGDNTARGRHRLDYAGGSHEQHFFLKNCGFFSETVELDQTFQRQSSSSHKPAIDWDELPR
ncbi:DUF3472 domain-containing protein [Roseiconus lacunae]|nr:DUF3472 domain-containing protein [Roseiconus lacunae]